MKKLYEVRLERVLMVMAEDEKSAEQVAIKHESEDCGLVEPEIATASLANSISEEWSECIPYGSDDDLTCEQILEKKE